jgi:plasmid stabilization system protein ParE
VEAFRPLKLRITLRAYKHLREIEAYIAKDNAGASRRIGVRLRSSFDLICQFPDIGRRVRSSPELEWTVPGLPFVIVYRVRLDVVEILGVFHGKCLRRGP